ncbi:MAG: hypothetical protein A2057_02720 [Ignavibacteria bacterium GWA2_35_9]|nr:MAG: hypothetical protein A2057_02720 [Ignavibacteria bacterium GWA2_35_9]OGU49036.1 MAG: hypothetical protein A2080_03110 [Ignavibacteria bacterium GWC2_36_12]OGU95260.1 MAG: hypothetical protein A2330_05465 [Ignavibacteria bacterium RIFOXYB2_FULL_36_7]
MFSHKTITYTELPLSNSDDISELLFLYSLVGNPISYLPIFPALLKNLFPFPEPTAGIEPACGEVNRRPAFAELVTGVEPRLWRGKPVTSKL